MTMKMKAIRQIGVLVCMLLLGMVLCACKGGGGGGSASEDTVNEEVVEPEPSWEEEQVAVLVKSDQDTVELVVDDGTFYMRLECNVSVTGGYRGTVLGGAVRCNVENPNTYAEEPRSLMVQSGRWEQSIGVDAEHIGGLRFELTCTDADSQTVSSVNMTITGMELHVINAAERSGSMIKAGDISLSDSAYGSVYVMPPVSGAPFTLKTM